jgi:hypothetical protein
MWGAIIASVATIVVVLYMQGPIVALTLTAASSLALLVAMRIEERRTRGQRPQAQPLQVIDGKTKEDMDLIFPPLRQKAS